jgi:hypothetical protein
LKTLIKCFCTLSLLAWCWLSMEALVCSTNHSGVINFYAIHIGTMEVYQLWWNEGTFWEILKYHDSQNQSFNNQELLWRGGWILSLANVSWHLDEHEWDWLGHFCASWMQSNNLRHCIMIYHKTTSCCIFHQTTFRLYTLVCVIGGRLGG